jgi:hypothetical protein
VGLVSLTRTETLAATYSVAFHVRVPNDVIVSIRPNISLRLIRSRAADLTSAACRGRRAFGDEKVFDVDKTNAPRMLYILCNVHFGLVETAASDASGRVPYARGGSPRRRVVSQVSGPIVHAFWQNEFAGWNDRYRVEAFGDIIRYSIADVNFGQKEIEYTYRLRTLPSAKSSLDK